MEGSPLDRLDETSRRYRRTERAHEQSRDAVIAAVVAALQAGERPTDVVRHSPFTDAYVRRIARQHGIEGPAKKGRPTT
jgi:hypothetical protein